MSYVYRKCLQSKCWYRKRRHRVGKVCVALPVAVAVEVCIARQGVQAPCAQTEGKKQQLARIIPDLQQAGAMALILVLLLEGMDERIE